MLDIEYKQQIFDAFVFEPGTDLGDNTQVILKVLEVIDNFPQSEITDTIFQSFDILSNSFSIFPSEDNMGFNPFLKFLEVNSNLIDNDGTKIAHELGHVLLNLLNNTMEPTNYEEILSNARSNTKNVNHIDLQLGSTKFTDARFRIILEHICHRASGDPNLKYWNERIQQEPQLAAFSDIIGSMWPAASYFPTNDGYNLVLPSKHSPEYYYARGSLINQNEQPIIDYKTIFDEQFANFFSLYVNGHYNVLDTLKQFFGTEWYQVMENNLIQIAYKLKQAKESSYEGRQMH